MAAAKAMGIDTLRVIDTGLDPVTAEREQWDDGNNTLAIAPAAGRGVRAQHRDQRPARGGRHRGGPRSPAASSAAAAAGRAACPARSAATRWAAEPGRCARRGMEGPERNRRGMQQRSGPEATISEVGTDVSQSPGITRTPNYARRVLTRTSSPVALQDALLAGGFSNGQAELGEVWPIVKRWLGRRWSRPTAACRSCCSRAA